MSVSHVVYRALVGAVFLGLIAGCSQPPPPSAETMALEDSLLTVTDVGGSFVTESRGGVGVTGGGVCPESDFAFDDVGVVRVSFVSSADDDDVVLIEMLRATESGELGTLFPALKAAYRACFGEVWTDYGDTQTVESMVWPEVGDDRIAVHALHGDPPFDGRHDDIRVVYIRAGDTFMEISVSETLEDGDDSPSVSDAELSRIVRDAVANLSA